MYEEIHGILDFLLEFIFYRAKIQDFQAELGVVHS
jgi:hypothetical protein